MHACYTAGTEITLTSFWGQHIRQVAQTQLLILWKLLRFALEVFVSVFFVTFPFWSCSLQLWLLVPWLLYEERGGGQSIGVSECSNSAYISSSLCPGQRVQRLHAVFSIPSPPTRPLSLSWLSDCTFSLCSGIPSSCTWPGLKRACCVCVYAHMWGFVCLNASYRKHLLVKKRKHEPCIFVCV